MGTAFSSLSGYIERLANVFVRHLIFFPIESVKEEVDSGKDENTSDIQNQVCPDGSDLKLDENREDDVMREEPKPSNGMKCTYNVQVDNGGNVVTGDNNRITIRQSEQLVRKLPIVRGIAIVVPEDVDAEAQSSSRTGVKNITVHEPYIEVLVVGEGNVIYVLQECNFCPDEASNFEQNVNRRLFPLRSDPLVLPSPGVHPDHKKVFDRMCLIVDQLYPLRDSGQWQQFENSLNRLQSRYGIHPAIKCFLLLEESVKLTYQKRLKAAKKKAEGALNIVNNEPVISGTSHDVLKILANVALASIFRRLPMKKPGKAFKCLQDARESSKRLKGVNLTIPKFALAVLDYEQARCYMEFATVKGESKCCNQEACKFLGLCIDRCRALSDNNELYTARQTFALIYLARLSLPTTTSCSEPGQCKQAENHLQEYERSHSHLGDYPVAAQVKAMLTRSELCFLERNYSSAKNFGCQALDIAVKYGFELETVPAQNHVEQISRYCSSTMRQEKLGPRVKNLSRCYSSSTSTDSDQKYNFTGSQRAT